MIIEIIRHGETEWMPYGRYQGVSDIPLSEIGKEQLEKAAYCPESVCVTPLIRTQETAACIFPDARQIVIPDLGEMNFGIFEGRSAAEMENDEQYRSWVDSMCLDRCPGGETKEEFCGRVCAAFSALMEEWLAKENRVSDLLDEPSHVIVAHGGTAMAIMERFSGEDKPFYKWHLKSGCGYVLDCSLWNEKKQLKFRAISNHNRVTKPQAV